VNSRLLKVSAAVAVALVIAVIVGYFWGASGRREAEERVRHLETMQWLAEARGRLLAGHVDLFALNFGSAARHFEQAKVPLDRLGAQYDRERNQAAAAATRRALASAEEARAFAAQIDPSAQGAVQRALGALSDLHPRWN
jgi:hypothetical protein